MKIRIATLEQGQSFEFTDSNEYLIHNSTDRRAMIDQASTRMDDMLFEAQLASRSIHTPIEQAKRKYSFSMRVTYTIGDTNENGIARCTAVSSVIVKREQ